jgi:DNA-binding CsgD family transcriptional regulator
MKAAKNVRAMVTGEGAVLRDMRRGGSFGLNPLGAKVWKLLLQGVATEQIIDQISVDFHASRETVENDVREFIQKLEDQKLIVREETATTH